jgi:hypothetical protein
MPSKLPSEKMDCLSTNDVTNIKKASYLLTIGFDHGKKEVIDVLG